MLQSYSIFLSLLQVFLEQLSVLIPYSLFIRNRTIEKIKKKPTNTQEMNELILCPQISDITVRQNKCDGVP